MTDIDYSIVHITEKWDDTGVYRLTDGEWVKQETSESITIPKPCCWVCEHQVKSGAPYLYQCEVLDWMWISRMKGKMECNGKDFQLKKELSGD